MTQPSSPRRRNECTRLIQPHLRLVEEPWSDERIFRHHFAALRALYNQVEAGYVVATVHANRTLCGADIVRSGEHVVVGRHGLAELPLEREPTAALRHLLVRVERSAAGLVARLLDLRTGTPFVLAGGAECEAAVADGDVFARFGPHVLLALKRDQRGRRWGDDVAAVWRQRPRVEIEADAADHTPPPPPVRRRRGARLNQQSREITRVTQIPSVVEGLCAAGRREVAADAVATISVELSDGTALAYDLTAPSLRRGVLLGRYPRCGVMSRGLWQEQAVSRVHALVMGDEQQAVILDTASSGGTFVDGRLVRAAELSEGSVIELSSGNHARWHWRAAASG